ncbi:MAG: hypothetical protein DI582_06055 [Azospirillum brasilense]|nr:MAG: hypothetical protein DI582_06055 [Azospirillum brasilense]
MWWLFVRDFYRAGEQAAPVVEAEAMAPPPRAARPAKKSKAAVSPRMQVRSAPVDAAPAPVFQNAEPTAPSITSYLQRLSVDGEHAFGLWDEACGFSVFSANFERICGLSSADCAGHDWIHSIHHTQQYAVNEALLNAAHEGRNGQCLVQARPFEDAEWNWLLLDIKAPTVQQHAVMVLMRNVSDERALDEALKQTETALNMAERGRSAFLSSMSHELRTPLNAIMGFSEMMKSGVFGELNNSTYQQYAEHIHDSGKLLLGKVNDLLDIASMDAKGVVLSEEPCNVRSLLSEVVEIHSHAAFTRQQTLKLDCTQAIEIEADRAKLICAISHFISNALRHSPDGAEITLCARLVPMEGLIISVRDHGEGIPQAQLQTIRDALQAESASYTQIEPGGIGLGLSLARELAVSHGGRIMVDSMRHRGTVVALTLPESRVRSGMPKRKRLN